MSRRVLWWSLVCAAPAWAQRLELGEPALIAPRPRPAIHAPRHPEATGAAAGRLSERTLVALVERGVGSLTLLNAEAQRVAEAEGPADLTAALQVAPAGGEAWVLWSGPGGGRLQRVGPDLETGAELALPSAVALVLPEGPCAGWAASPTADGDVVLRPVGLCEAPGMGPALATFEQITVADLRWAATADGLLVLGGAVEPRALRLRAGRVVAEARVQIPGALIGVAPTAEGQPRLVAYDGQSILTAQTEGPLDQAEALEWGVAASASGSPWPAGLRVASAEGRAVLVGLRSEAPDGARLRLSFFGGDQAPRMIEVEPPGPGGAMVMTSAGAGVALLGGAAFAFEGARLSEGEVLFPAPAPPRRLVARAAGEARWVWRQADLPWPRWGEAGALPPQWWLGPAILRVGEAWLSAGSVPGGVEVRQAGPTGGAETVFSAAGAGPVALGEDATIYWHGADGRLRARAVAGGPPRSFEVAGDAGVVVRAGGAADTLIALSQGGGALVALRRSQAGALISLAPADAGPPSLGSLGPAGWLVAYTEGGAVRLRRVPAEGPAGEALSLADCEGGCAPQVAADDRYALVIWRARDALRARVVEWGPMRPAELLDLGPASGAVGLARQAARRTYELIWPTVEGELWRRTLIIHGEVAPGLEAPTRRPGADAGADAGAALDETAPPTALDTRPADCGCETSRGSSPPLGWLTLCLLVALRRARRPAFG